MSNKEKSFLLPIEFLKNKSRVLENLKTDLELEKSVDQIVKLNSDEEITLSSGTVSVSYSDIQGGWEGTGNINADPLFCNADGNDFTLYNISPCVGTGQDGANMGAYGIGCYLDLVISHVFN